jgi:hypothetical protein
VELRYFRPIDSLCCGRGILALEFHNFVARLRSFASHLLRLANGRREKLEGVHTILEMALPVTLSGCEAPRVPMVEPAHPRQSYKGAMALCVAINASKGN